MVYAEGGALAGISALVETRGFCNTLENVILVDARSDEKILDTSGISFTTISYSQIGQCWSFSSENRKLSSPFVMFSFIERLQWLHSEWTRTIWRFCTTIGVVNTNKQKKTIYVFIFLRSISVTNKIKQFWFSHIYLQSKKPFYLPQKITLNISAKNRKFK